MAEQADAWGLFDEEPSVGPTILNPSRDETAADVDIGPVKTPAAEPLRLRLGAQVPLHYTLKPLHSFFTEHCKHTLEDLQSLSGPVSGEGSDGSSGAGNAQRGIASTASARHEPASEGAASLHDALKAAYDAVMQLDESRRIATKSAGKKGPAAAAAAETEAVALDQLHGAGDALVDTAWAWMKLHRQWPHVAWREAYAHGQIARAVALSHGGDPLAGMHAVDMALIMGAPAEELEAIVSPLEMACTVVKAANAAADGAGKCAHAAASSSADAAAPLLSAPGGPLPTIPAVLGPDAELDLPSDLSPDHAILRVTVLTTGPARRVASCEAPPLEHPRLVDLRTPHESGRPLSLSDFRRRFLKASIPVVLSGGTRNWGALDAWRDLEALCAAHGHRTVPIEVGQHLSGYWREEAMLLRSFVTTYIVPSLGWGWGTKVRVAPVGDAPAPPAVAAAAAADPSVTTVHPSAIAYLAQHGLFEQLPALTKDIDVPLYCGNEVGAVNAWFGTPGTVTRAHFDDYENLYVQVAGYKLVRLYAPCDSDKMYRIVSATGAANPGRAGGDKAPAPAASAPAAAAPTGGKKGKVGAVDKAPSAGSSVDATLGQGNVSGVDVEHPDLDAHPAFAGAVRHDAVLGPGDMLFIPKGWWHYLRALTTSFSINFWFEA